MRKWLFVIPVVFLFAGCWITNFRDAASTSKNTPYAEGERPIEERAEKYAEATKNLPWGAGVVVYPLAVVGIGFVLHGIRGMRLQRIQKLGTSTHPYTGEVGKTINLESVVQVGADILAALFEFGKDGTAAKRGWKGFLYGFIGSGTLLPIVYPHLITWINDFTTHPPAWLTGTALSISIGLATAIAAYVEKKFGEVKPISTVSTPPLAQPIN